MGLRRKPSSEQHNHARPPHPWCRCLSTEGRLRVWRSTQAPSSPSCRQAQASLVRPLRSKGVSYNSKSCSEGCCFYTPASSKRVQEIEAEVEKNLPTWFRTPAGGCDAVPSSTYNSRLVLNKDNNDSGNEAALCVKSKDSDTFELLTGETTSCKGKCCVFQCKSCKAPES